jgi:hypothetical protein
MPKNVAKTSEKRHKICLKMRQKQAKNGVKQAENRV